MNFRIRSFIRYQAPAFFWAGCIYIASSIPSDRITWYILHRIDKIIHIAIFFILGLLVYRAMYTQNRSPSFTYKKVWIMLFIVIGYGILDELHQAGTPGRTVDVLDLLADAGGGVLAGVAAFLFRKPPDRSVPVSERAGTGK